MAISQQQVQELISLLALVGVEVVPHTSTKVKYPLSAHANGQYYLGQVVYRVGVEYSTLVHEAIHVLQYKAHKYQYTYKLKRVYSSIVKSAHPSKWGIEAEAHANENNIELILAHFRKMLGKASTKDELIIKLNTPIF